MVAKSKKQQKIKWALILWEDACFEDADLDYDDARDYGVFMWSAGIVVKDTKNVICLASDVFPQDRTGRRILTVPKAYIKKQYVRTVVATPTKERSRGVCYE